MGTVIKLSSPATREFWEIPVLYEDADLLALDKPPGLLASPDRGDPARPNLMDLLHAGIREGKPWAAERGVVYLMNAHRSDFETSGVILLAKAKPKTMTKRKDCVLCLRIVNAQHIAANEHDEKARDERPPMEPAGSPGPCPPT